MSPQKSLGCPSDVGRQHERHDDVEKQKDELRHAKERPERATQLVVLVAEEAPDGAVDRSRAEEQRALEGQHSGEELLASEIERAKKYK